jgi:hypothetical protein
MHKRGLCLLVGRKAEWLKKSKDTKEHNKRKSNTKSLYNKKKIEKAILKGMEYTVNGCAQPKLMCHAV